MRELERERERKKERVMRSGCANGLRKNAQRGSEAEGATNKYDYISEPGELRR